MESNIGASRVCSIGLATFFSLIKMSFILQILYIVFSGCLSVHAYIHVSVLG